MYKFLGPRSQEFSSGAEKMCVCERERVRRQVGGVG